MIDGWKWVFSSTYRKPFICMKLLYFGGENMVSVVNVVKLGGKVLVNLTPHDITVYDAKKEKVILTIPRSGKVARVQETLVGYDKLEDVPIVTKRYGRVVVVDQEGNTYPFPEPTPNTIYIVSLLVAQALRGRHDVLTPDTGAGAVRDERGMIKGTTRFMRFAL